MSIAFCNFFAFFFYFCPNLREISLFNDDIDDLVGYCDLFDHGFALDSGGNSLVSLRERDSLILGTVERKNHGRTNLTVDLNCYLNGCVNSLRLVVCGPLCEGQEALAAEHLVISSQR